jgi:hypothetical protein
MTLEERQTPSPVVAMYQALQARNSRWCVEVGQPRGPGWMPGTALLTATESPFQALLALIGEGLQTADRRTIAASFALRYGWSSGIAIAPYVLYSCVPKITLDNVSFKLASRVGYRWAEGAGQEVTALPHRRGPEGRAATSAQGCPRWTA